MKANELRVGNYVQFWGDKEYPSKVIGFNNGIVYLHFSDANYINPELIDCSPIPLTEEWLLKFGFEKKKDYYNRCYFSIDGMDIRIDDNKFETEVGESIYKTIDYVHQLQNLYFALNDEELTMK